jgi:hypothetical protein
VATGRSVPPLWALRASLIYAGAPVRPQPAQPREGASPAASVSTPSTTSLSPG